MKTRVAFFEFTVWDNVVPLATGLLEASARQRPHLRDAYEFTKHSYNVRKAPIDDILGVDADVYAFSCYVWNTGLVRRLWPQILARRPAAQLLLGGPQVMHKGESYLSADHDNVAICNGEGEQTFANYLEELLAPRPDLTKVNGLSLYRDRQLIVTSDQARIQDFDNLASPYLDGLFAGRRFVYGVIETNRGCPFKCTYCYWGASTNSNVRRYPQGRIFEEIEWLSRNRAYMILIADANFGMLQRDEQIAAHIAECKAKYGFPTTVSFSASKNTPAKNAKVVKVFADSKLLSALPIAIQSTSEEVLKRVERSNISSGAYMQLQSLVNDRGQSSYVELIWPLPGETLTSFKHGVARLFRLGASTFNAYPLLLINNVPMEAHRERYGLVTVADEDPNSEAALVVATDDVSRSAYLEGLRFLCHVTSLLSSRGLALLARHLDATGVLSCEALIDSFDAFCRRVGRHSYTSHVARVAASSEFFSWGMLGSVFHVVSGRYIQDFDRLLHDFVQSLDCWDDEAARLVFELDLLNRPYAYRNTKMVDRRDKLDLVRIEHLGDRDIVRVELPAAHAELAASVLGLEHHDGATRFEIRYKTEQLPYVVGKPELDYHTYCTGLLLRMNAIAPTWTPIPSAVVAGPFEERDEPCVS